MREDRRRAPGAAAHLGYVLQSRQQTVSLRVRCGKKSKKSNLVSAGGQKHNNQQTIIQSHTSRYCYCYCCCYCCCCCWFCCSSHLRPAVLLRERLQLVFGKAVRSFLIPVWQRELFPRAQPTINARQDEETPISIVQNQERGRGGGGGGGADFLHALRVAAQTSDHASPTGYRYISSDTRKRIAGRSVDILLTTRVGFSKNIFCFCFLVQIISTAKSFSPLGVEREEESKTQARGYTRCHEELALDYSTANFFCIGCLSFYSRATQSKTQAAREVLQNKQMCTRNPYANPFSTLQDGTVLSYYCVAPSLHHRITPW